MDKEKQIELAKILTSRCAHDCPNIATLSCDLCQAQTLIDNDYRKINDNEVVISKEEYESFTKLSIYDKPVKHRIYEFINDMKERTRKETAREIFNDIVIALTERRENAKDFYGIKESVGVDMSIRTVKFFAEKYGVDLGETK